MKDFVVDFYIVRLIKFDLHTPTPNLNPRRHIYRKIVGKMFFPCFCRQIQYHNPLVNPFRDSPESISIDCKKLLCGNCMCKYFKRSMDLHSAPNHLNGAFFVNFVGTWKNLAARECVL